MSFHGGLIGVIVAALLYARRRGAPFFALMDLLAAATPIGLFLGRIANFINGELYGRVTAVPWAMRFPKELYEMSYAQQDAAIATARAINPAWNSIPVIEQATIHSEPLRQALAPMLHLRHPSQLYEAALEGVVLFALLWILRTRVRLANGVLTGAFFIGYALLRIAGEIYREPDAPLTGPFTRGQFLSLFLIAIGVAFLVSAKLRPTWAPRWSRGR